MTTIDLSSFFKTKSQAADFSARLNSVIAEIYLTDFNLENSLVQQFGIQKKDALLSIIREQSIVISSNTAIKDFFTSLQESITKTSVLSITMAFEPSEKMLQTLSQWFLMNMNKQVLFDVTVDPSIVGGGIISYNGKYLDASIKPVFMTILQQSLQPAQEAPPSNTDHQSAEHLSLGR